MKLAVCLLTADRADYTADTLASYVEHADRDEYLKLHADDGSETRSNRLIAEAAGFETVYASPTRKGPMEALRAMWRCAERAGATHILHLENDQEFCAALPSAEVIEEWECIRLYGARKARGGPRELTGPHLLGTNIRIMWTPCHNVMDPNVWESAVAHWAGPPSITRADLLIWAVNAGARRVKDVANKLHKLSTLRPVNNIVWHIGDQRTPKGMFNS